MPSALWTTEFSALLGLSWSRRHDGARKDTLSRLLETLRSTVWPSVIMGSAKRSVGVSARNPLLAVMLCSTISTV